MLQQPTINSNPYHDHPLPASMMMLQENRDINREMVERVKGKNGWTLTAVGDIAINSFHSLISHGLICGFASVAMRLTSIIV